MLNHVTLMGRLTRDPELKNVGSASIPLCNFVIAVERDGGSTNAEKKVDYVSVSAWRKTAEFIARNFTKGKMIVIGGRLESSEWTDGTGTKRARLSVVVNDREVYFADNKRSGASSGTAKPAPAPAPAEPATDFAMLDDDDAQLPF